MSFQRNNFRKKLFGLETEATDKEGDNDTPVLELPFNYEMTENEIKIVELFISTIGYRKERVRDVNQFSILVDEEEGDGIVRYSDKYKKRGQLICHMSGTVDNSIIPKELLGNAGKRGVNPNHKLKLMEITTEKKAIKKMIDEQNDEKNEVELVLQKLKNMEEELRDNVQDNNDKEEEEEIDDEFEEDDENDYNAEKYFFDGEDEAEEDDDDAVF